MLHDPQHSFALFKRSVDLDLFKVSRSATLVWALAAMFPTSR